MRRLGAKNRQSNEGPCDDCGTRDASRYVRGLCIRCYNRTYMRDYRGTNGNKRCAYKGWCRDDALELHGKLSLCRAHHWLFYGVDPAARD